MQKSLPKMESQGNISRLAKLQIRYQQKQKEEMDRKRNEFISSRAAISPLDFNENNRIHIGNGKVRQMFDERRQRVTGIDKSYPLQPISTKTLPSNSGRQLKNTATTTITSNSFNRNAIPSRINDLDYIENEQIPDIFSQLDDIDSLESGRRMANMERQMANLSVGNNNSFGNGSANIKLAPVITRKTITHSSANSLNTLKRLPPTTTKIRSMPLTPEKSSLNQRNVSSWSVSPVRKGSVTPSESNSASTRSSASSNSSGKQSAKMSAGPPPEGMTQCPMCKRNFNNDRIQKHESICKKTTTKKRKIFDATKHRVKGTEAEAYVKKSAKTVKKKPAETANKKSDWRRKHEEFIQAIRSAKQMQQHLAKGGKLSDLPPPPVSENPDYVQCPHCNRKFNESAAARHIPKCANYAFNKPKPNTKSKPVFGRNRT